MNALKRASGGFEVTLTPLPNAEVSSHPLLGRMLLVKKFSGDLVADARGQMLSAGTSTRGSACYVAIDHVTGTIEGRTGGFLLQHCGTMNRGEPSLSIQVVPDSGTEDLVGLTGTLRINIVEGKHFYEFDFQLPDRQLPDRS